MTNKFHQLLNLAKHNKQTFGREIKCETYRVEGKILAITNMHDDFHDIRLALFVGENLTIQNLAISMERIPYMICENSTKTYDEVKGLYIFQKGILKEIRNKIKREEGCTHIFEMMESTLRALFAEVSSNMGERYRERLELDEARQLGIQNPLLKNTCIAFDEKGKDEQILDKAITKLGKKEKTPIIK